MNRKTLVTILLPVIVTTLVAIVAFGKCNGKGSWQKDTGFIFGTSYNITVRQRAAHSGTFRLAQSLRSRVRAVAPLRYALTVIEYLASVPGK